MTSRQLWPGRARHRRATEQQPDGPRPAAPATEPTGVDEFVRTVLPGIIRSVCAGTALSPHASALAQQAAWQITRVLYQVQDDAHQDLLAGIAPLHTALTEQRHYLGRRHTAVIDPALLNAIEHTNAQALRATRRATVLANGPWPRSRGDAVPLLDIAWGAHRSIGNHQRVEINPSVPAVAVPGAVAEPLLAAIAELLDNAARAAAQVNSMARMTIEPTAHGGVTVTVTDPGPGMDALALARANALLQRRPPLPSSDPARPLGLRTVALACAAGGFHPELTSAPGAGTSARLHLPADLITGAAEQPQPSTEHALGVSPYPALQP